MIGLACGLCASVAAAAPGVPATPPAPVPPALAPLEQKMMALQVSTERVSIHGVLAGHGGGGASFLLALPGGKGLSASSFRETGSIRFSPAEASLNARFGISSIARRQIGRTTYVRVPPLAHIDGGRPWVAERPPSVDAPTGYSPGAPASDGRGFPGVLALLEDAVSIVGLGASHVDGGPVERFQATLDPGELPQLTSSERQQLARQGTTVELEVFLSAAGAPVRTVMVRRAPHVTDTLTTDVLALNVALAKVLPPPANQTISSRALAKLPRGPL
jgi:hypothetical protein